MGIFGPSKKAFKELERKLEREIETRNSFMGFLQTAFGGADIPSLNMGSALKSSAVWACVRIIASSIASLTINVLQKLPDGTFNPAPQKNLQTLLSFAPNQSMTAYTFVETVVVHLLLRGNAFIWKQRDASGRIVALYPLYPDRVALHIMPDGTKQFYIAGMEFDAFDILHIPGMTIDGFVGISVISLLDGVILRDISISEYARKFFDNGAYPGGVIETPKGLSDVGYTRLKTSWESMHQGARNAHKTAILEEGATYKPITISAKDAQLIETKNASVEDIARLFGVPLHMIHVAAKAAFNSNEQMSLDFLIHTLNPWIVRIEQAFNGGLFSLNDLGRFVVRINVDSILRADIKTRMEAYQTGREIGLYSINEIRAMENLNPIPDGDEHNLMIPGAPIPLNAQAPTETEQEENGGQNEDKP
jgi:HK97 family phage portal protein